MEPERRNDACELNNEKSRGLDGFYKDWLDINQNIFLSVIVWTANSRRLADVCCLQVVHDEKYSNLSVVVALTIT